MKIVVPNDGSAISARAIPYALVMPPSEGAEIILLRIIEKREPVRDLLGRITKSPDDVARDDAARAAEDLKALENAMIAPYQVKITHRVRIGVPAAEIAAVADDERADMVVMTSHGRGAAGRWTFGSVADEVSRAPGPPLLIVRFSEEQEPERALDIPATLGRLMVSLPLRPVPEADVSSTATIERIVVPIDGSELSKRAVPLAADLAARLQVPLKLLMAVDLKPVGPPLMMDPAWGPEAGNILAEIEDEANDILTGSREAIHRQHGGLEISTDVLRGPAGSTIIATTLPTDLVVMSSRGRAGFGRLLLGSVADQLIRTGRCPVLLVRATRHERAETA